jgi:ubiquinone/menaquinone biosynthesis C-methylase UbiE
MDPSSIEYYRCPQSHSRLRLVNAVLRGNGVQSGELTSTEGRRFAIEVGVPNLIWPLELSDIEARTKGEYDHIADKIYDAAVDWQFAALYEDEDKVRESMVDMLGPKSSDCILEVGCGTGRDSFRLARRLGAGGKLFLQDLSPKMVHTCIKKMMEYDSRMHFQCTLHYSISNATYLPFPQDFFDAVFHFGGCNQFSDLKRASAEFARVVKPGGMVLYGDESVAPWLRGTEFERIVCTNNPLFRHELPLDTIPECARDVTVRWIMANCFYVITFRKGEGPPPLDLDLPHKGWRGGTMRSRYFGRLEGVTPEAKELAHKAAASLGLSVHEWLDRLVRKQAADDIGQVQSKRPE